jgi:hypothetical protein
MPARVGENQGECRGVGLNFAGGHIPPGDSANDLRLAQPHRAGAVRVSDFGLDVILTDTVGIETNLANRFTVQLVLAVPFVDGAALFTAQQFIMIETARPRATGVKSTTVSGGAANSTPSSVNR